MIRHFVTPERLRASILNQDAKWFEKAKDVVKSLPPVPTSTQFKSLWSDIKQVWIDLQGSKCMYCETLIEGAVSNDIEHFRPKAEVAIWKVPKAFVAEGVKVTPAGGPKGDPGYRNLAYHPWNYAASCKHCNSVLKKNYFPIAGKRNSAAKNPRTMKGERALFLYPIGDVDDDPETLIRFVGMHPEPAAPKGSHGYHRALVMIEAFRLNDAEHRKELFRARAYQLKSLFDALDDFHHGTSAAVRQDGEDWIRIFQDHRAPHANCMRCFKAIYDHDEVRAGKLLADAKWFLQNGTLATPMDAP
jgi:5-methylcytosine-specific restriction endonuclease McrA